MIKGQGCQYQWPLGLDSDLPANLLVVSLGTSGPGEVVEDNSARVLSALFDQSGMEPSGMATPDPPAAGMPIGGEASPLAGGMGMEPMQTATGPSGEMLPGSSEAAESSSGCSVASREGALTPLAGLLAAGALLLARRRRA